MVKEPVRIETRLYDALIAEKGKLRRVQGKGRIRSVSDVIKFHRSHSRRFLKFNREFSRFVKDRPTTTLREFYDHCLKQGIIKF